MTSTSNGNQGNGNASSMDPTALLKMLNDLLQRTTQMFACKDTKDTNDTKGDCWPMDPNAFIKSLQQMIKQVTENAESMMGFTDPTSLMKKSADGKPKTPWCSDFTKMFQEMMNQTMGKDGKSGPMDMMQVMNPLWWMEQMSSVMTGNDCKKKAAK